MRLTTVGTGTAAPHPRRVCSGHLVEAGAVRLLMDCGSGVVHRMAELGLAWESITHLALTHFHNDHVSDLATLMIGWRHGQLPPRAEPVTIVGPDGTRALLERMAASNWDDLLTPGFPVVVHELAPGVRLDLGEGVTLEPRKVPHTAESVAWAVERGPRRLVYTGDTSYDEGLADWAAGCDLFLVECSLPASMAIPSHLTPEQCGRLAGRAQPRHLALTHFYPPVERVDIRAAVAESFGGPVTPADDGWAFAFEE